MADASLDDFFAKKDKSKKKSKGSKVKSGDNITKSEGDTVKKEKKKKDKERTATDSTNNGTKTGLIEEEWKEVEEEKEKDYTGLRIANLQISEKEEEEEEENEDDDDSDDENKEKKDSGQQGPWKGAAPNPPQKTQPQTVEEDEAPKPVESTPKTSGRYIPPAQRAAASGSAVSSPGPTVPSHILNRKKKAAPNLGSEEDFPTLGTAPPPIPIDTDTRNFERVQHGGRQIDDPSKNVQTLSLGNKFSALQD